jgi:hypothetical protein
MILAELLPVNKKMFWHVHEFCVAIYTEACPNYSSEFIGAISSKLYRNDQYQV